MKPALLDSNVLIYAANGNTESLREFICSAGNAVSSITRIEVFGFSGLKQEEKASLDTLFAFLDVYSLDERVIAKSIELRQIRRMGLADAIIAATALVHAMPLVTRNADDFKAIEGLEVINPFDAGAI
jgi:predicted nucleic acid-binding protein